MVINCSKVAKEGATTSIKMGIRPMWIGVIVIVK